jgi:hypothetical protein
MPIRHANFSAKRCSRDSEVELSMARVNKNESEARNVLQPVINETPYTLPKTTQRAFDALDEINNMSTL